MWQKIYIYTYTYISEKKSSDKKYIKKTIKKLGDMQFKNKTKIKFCTRWGQDNDGTNGSKVVQVVSHIVFFTKVGCRLQLIVFKKDSSKKY